MKKNDIVVISVVIALSLLFITIPNAMESFRSVNISHGYLMSFLKFAILATFGEILALRIITGNYWHPGFGLIAKMLVWGCLGILIKIAFGIFSFGTPQILASLGFPVTVATLSTGSLPMRLLTAFAISTAMNIIFAPPMMILHKITDTHIHQTGGKISSLLPMDFPKILSNLDWNTLWNFVFKKTIPLFWIPAHTLTFMLPPEFRILFAAFLGVMLGLILAIAGTRKPLR